jgi:GntR family transcriptional regulator/MocR family aminotransferase
VAPPQGIQELRVGIARYLRQYRSVFCTPGQIIVTSGTRHALDLVARTVFPADRPVAVDEPGCPVTRIALQHRGLRLTGVPSDQDGLLVDALPADAGAVVTSAARHRPHGNVLSLQRRHALLTWAKRTDAVVVETDPGLEFAVGVAPLPSLLALAGEQPCVHIGSFSDVFTPTLRIGYLLGQTHLLAAAAESIAVLGEQPDLMTQRATAQLLGNNELASHVARMTRLYEAKRRLIRELVAPVSGLVTGLRLSRGFDAVIELAARVPAADVSDALAEQGIILPTVENYYLTSAGQECNALILGFGYLSRSQLLSGLTAVVSAIKKASCRGRMMVRAEVVVLRAMNSTSRS